MEPYCRTRDAGGHHTSCIFSRRVHEEVFLSQALSPEGHQSPSPAPRTRIPLRADERHLKKNYCYAIPTPEGFKQHERAPALLKSAAAKGKRDSPSRNTLPENTKSLHYAARSRVRHHLVWILFLVELRDSLTVFLFFQILWLLRRIVGVVSHSFLTSRCGCNTMATEHPLCRKKDCNK